MKKKAILVHGGAWATPEDEREPHRKGTHLAVQAGWDILFQGGSALDAVTTAVRLMEGDSTFNAGRGAVLNAAGEVELDAAVMEGTNLATGAVAAVQGIEHPIDLARRVMERSPHALIVGPGALSFARTEGLSTCSASALIVDRERERWEQARKEQAGQSNKVLPNCYGSGSGDTVGAVACDQEGRLAAASSTGGALLKLPGRVGDCPLVGCGLYADDRSGAATATGWGEGNIRIVLARRAVELLSSQRAAPEAARQAIGMLEARVNGRGGVILVDPEGNLGFAFNTPCMTHAYLTDGMTEPVSGI